MEKILIISEWFGSILESVLFWMNLFDLCKIVRQRGLGLNVLIDTGYAFQTCDIQSGILFGLKFKIKVQVFLRYKYKLESAFFHCTQSL